MTTYEQIINNLKNKIYYPIYFLSGEEPYFIDQISDFIQGEVLTEEEKAFNLLVLYGKDTDVGTVINSAKRYPMMSNYQVVILKEAQNLKDIDNLVNYFEKPLKSTILVINYKYSKVDKRKKYIKIVSEKYLFFDSARLYDNQVPDWISMYLKKSGYTIDSSAAMLLTEFLGTEIGKIVNELDKLMLIIPKNQGKINTDHIEKNIGISKEYNHFELLKALGQKDVLKSNRIARHLSENQKISPIILTIGMIYGFYSKLLGYHYLSDKSKNNVAAQLGIRPFQIAEYESAAKKYPVIKLVAIIGYLKEYDLKSKGIGDVSSSQGELLSELIYKILH